MIMNKINQIRYQLNRTLRGLMVAVAIPLQKDGIYLFLTFEKKKIKVYF